jgi:hypothetical protein
MQQSYYIKKMSVFATLAKGRLNTESIKGSKLVAVRHRIDQIVWTVATSLDSK